MKCQNPGCTNKARKGCRCEPCFKNDVQYQQDVANIVNNHINPLTGGDYSAEVEALKAYIADRALKLARKYAERGKKP